MEGKFSVKNFGGKTLEGNSQSLSYILSLGESAFVSFDIFWLKVMDFSNGEVFLSSALTSSSCNNSIHFDECNRNSFTMNREKNFPLGLNTKDDERNIDEGQQKNFL